jgi:putative ABC transport system permease protein
VVKVNLSKIALQNIRHNFRHYFAYLVSISFAVVVFHLFLSVFLDENVQQLVQESENYQSVFQGSAVVVALFSIVFVWYSNSFFIKSRKKEIGLYSLLGARKAKIGRLLFYETLMLGGVAIVFGSMLGVIFSKYFSLLLLKLMDLQGSISLQITIKPIVTTVVVFIIIFLISAVHGFTLIYRFKLIELFHASKQGEKIKKPSLLVSLVSVAMISVAYYIGITASSETFIQKMLLIVLLLVIGTILLFSSFFVYFVYTLQKNKKYYYKNLNIFSVSQIVYRMKGNALTLAIVSISVSLVIFASVFTYVSYQNTLVMAQERSPFSFVYMRGSENVDEKVLEAIANSQKHDLVEEMTIEILGGSLSIGNEPARFMYVVSESTMNRIFSFHNKEQMKLPNHESIFVVDFLKNDYGSSVIGTSSLLQVGDQTSRDLTITGYDNFRMLNEGGALWNYAVVTDEIYQTLYTTDPTIYRSYQAIEVTNEQASEDLTTEIYAIVGEEANLDSYYAKYDEVLKGNAMMLFIGGFLSILFILATGSILYFKQLMEASNDIETYTILTKIGVTKTQIKKSIFKQMAFIFIAPLIVATIHSLSLLGVMKTFVSADIAFNLYAAIVIGIFTTLYLCFYYLTSKGFVRLVLKKS